MAKVYGYSQSGIRYFGKMTKSKFIIMVAKLSNSSNNWIKERTGETGNSNDLNGSLMEYGLGEEKLR